MTAQEQQSRAECRKAFEFELIDNHSYVPSDLNQIGGFYADDDVQFSWEAAWAVWKAARALPAGVKPVGYAHAGNLANIGDGYAYLYPEPVVGASVPVYTASQVLAMGRVPPGWQVTEEMHIAAVKVLHRSTGLAGLPQRMVDAMLAAAPRPPAAQEGEPVVIQQLTTEQIRKWWASENGLEDCDMCEIVDFTMVVREVESKLGITHPTGD